MRSSLIFEFLLAQAALCMLKAFVRTRRSTWDCNQNLGEVWLQSRQVAKIPAPVDSRTNSSVTEKISTAMPKQTEIQPWLRWPANWSSCPPQPQVQPRRRTRSWTPPVRSGLEFGTIFVMVNSFGVLRTHPHLNDLELTRHKGIERASSQSASPTYRSSASTSKMSPACGTPS